MRQIFYLIIFQNVIFFNIAAENGLESPSSPSSTIDYLLRGDFGEGANTRSISGSALNIGIGIGCAVVVLVFVTIGVILVIKKRRRESPPRETLEEVPRVKANMKDFQNPLYNMEGLDDGNTCTVKRDITFQTFRPDVV
ncbi:uncharacterized protein LOC135486416 [Lineus longissimus]|uniref:uncharacterized protein LOC135486416 n=1 Tax=Lineus longissimus TaxID=88925 RepID=UPI00315D5DC1